MALLVFVVVITSLTTASGQVVGDPVGPPVGNDCIDPPDVLPDGVEWGQDGDEENPDGWPGRPGDDEDPNGGKGGNGYENGKGGRGGDATAGLR